MSDYEDGYNRGRSGSNSSSRIMDGREDLLGMLFGIDAEKAQADREQGYRDGVRDRADEEAKREEEERKR